jgi:hypothetical protein
VGGRISAENACYIRLPDMPRGLYGGFGAINPESGVLTYAGGAEKRTEENTIAYYELYGIKLDGTRSSWDTIPYGASVGYTRDVDKGCREGVSVMLPGGTDSAQWLSVFGKDGCDNGAFDSGGKGGDIKELSVGADTSRSEVAWVSNSGAAELPAALNEQKGRLIREFATYDVQRGRLVFGQGTFDDEKDALTEDEVYVARKSGSKWQISEIRPSGEAPVKRYGTCATYVYDQSTGVDGVFVLGGQQGGTVDTTSYKEVWWLDFSSRDQGEWLEITSKFANMDDFGYRREGACGYNPQTKTFYSWMGRANSSIPDGASHSAGVWRTDLSNLGEVLAGNGSLAWERLAKDNQPGLKGRRLIPSVYDWTNNRLLVIGGRNGLDEYSDSWMIYPDVTGAACENLDPWPDVPTPTATDVPPPTRTPSADDTPVAATPTLCPNCGLDTCDYVMSRVPAAAVNAAIANPNQVSGYGELCYPGVPPSPYNQPRSKLSLRNPSVPYHPLFNGLVWSCGCP